MPEPIKPAGSTGGASGSWTPAPFNDIARTLDPMMPADDYDKMRSAYFWNTVHPKLSAEVDRRQAWNEFKSKTERKPLLTPAEKVITKVGVLATSSAAESMAPLSGVVPGVESARKYFEGKKTDLKALADREGLKTGIEEFAGTAVGMVPTMEALAPVAGAYTSKLLEGAQLSAKALEYAGRVVRGSASFGLYSFLSEDKGNRFVAGAKGAGIGAAWELTLGLVPFLKAKGVNNAEEVAQAAANGDPLPPEVDKLVTQHIESTAVAQEKQPFVFETKLDNKVRGAKQAIRDPKSGEVRAIPIVRGNEEAAYKQVQNATQNGWERGTLTYHEDHESSINRFLKLSETPLEAPPDHSIVSTAPGAANEVAKRMGGVVVGESKVAIPNIDPELGRKPELGSMTDKLREKGYSNQTTNEITRYVGQLWDPSLPHELKLSHVQEFRANSHLYDIVRDFLPEKYKLAPIEQQLQKVRELALTKGRLEPRFIIAELGVSRQEAWKLYEQASKGPNKFINYNTGDLLKLAEKEATPVATETRQFKDWKEGEPLPDSPRIITKAGTDVYEFPKHLTRGEYDKLQSLGYTEYEIDYMGEPASKEALFNETKNPRVEEAATKDSFTLESLRELAKSGGYAPETITQEQVERANALGKTSTEALLKRVEFGGKSVSGRTGTRKMNFEKMLSEGEIQASIPLNERHTNLQVKVASLEGKESATKSRAVVPSSEMGGAAGVTFFSKGEKPMVAINDELLSTDYLYKRKSTVYHENLHVNLFGANVNLTEHVPLETAKSLVGIIDHLKEVGYEGQSIKQLLEEAFTHTATAIRVGDQRSLDVLAKWDTSEEHLRQMMATVTSSILRTGMVDSVWSRALERNARDLLRRTSPFRSSLFKTVEESAGQVYHDGVSWNVVDKEGNVKKFLEDQALYDHLHDTELDHTGVSFSFPLEQKGVVGRLTDNGKGPGDPSRLPLPEVAIEAEQLGVNNLTQFFRPMLSSVASIHESINKVFAKDQKYFPLYESVKAVDEKLKEIGEWSSNQIVNIHKVLKGIPEARQFGIFQYWATEDQYKSTVAARLKMEPKDVEAARKSYEILKEFDKRVPGTIDYVTRAFPKLQKFSWNPDFGFGKIAAGTKDSQLGTFQRAIQVDKELNPSDFHAGRFLNWLTRKAVDKNMEKELGALSSLVNKKAADGKYILGNARYSMDNLIKYYKGIPDGSQKMINGMLTTVQGHYIDQVKKLNKTLPAWAKLDETPQFPQQILNKFMAFSYAAGVGFRPAVMLRDTAAALNALPILGSEYFFKGLKSVLSTKGFAHAAENGALLNKINFGDLWEDILGNTSIGGKGGSRVGQAITSVSDSALELSKLSLAGSRWGHNFGRAIVFEGEYARATEAINQFRAGKLDAMGLAKSTGGWFMDKPRWTQLLKMASEPEVAGFKSTSVIKPLPGSPLENDPNWRTASTELRKKWTTVEQISTPTKSGSSTHDVAKQFALELNDLTQWPYRKGTQPMMLRTGVGRLFGQYGLWPLNYVDYLGRLGKKSMDHNFRKEALIAGATWLAWNAALVKSMDGMGADVSKWYFVSPAGYGGGPNLKFAQDLMLAPEDTEEGKAARQRVMEFPLNFMPGNVQTGAIIKALEGDEEAWSNGKPGPGFWRVMGFKPKSEIDKDEDMTKWLEEETGTRGYARRYEKATGEK